VLPAKVVSVTHLLCRNPYSDCLRRNGVFLPTRKPICKLVFFGRCVEEPSNIPFRVEGCQSRLRKPDPRRFAFREQNSRQFSFEPNGTDLFIDRSLRRKFDWIAFFDPVGVEVSVELKDLDVRIPQVLQFSEGWANVRAANQWTAAAIDDDFRVVL
jgi:hypothetical protein